MSNNAIFGHVETDTMVLVNLYLIKALKPFNLYRLHDEYQKEYGLIPEGDDGDGGFSGWLVQEKELAVFVEAELEQEVLRQVLQFEVRPGIPSYLDITKVERVQTPAMLDLNFEQVRTLAEGLDFKVREKHELVENLLAMMTTKGEPVVKDYVDLVVAINFPKVQAHQKAIQEKQGFSVLSVFQESGVNFAHTEMLMDNCDFEIIAKGATSLNSLHVFVTEVANRVLHDPDFDYNSDEVFTSKVMTSLDGNTDVRLRLVDVPLEKVEALMSMELPRERFKQLYFGDLKNRLPGEDGHDAATFQQEI